MIRSAGIAYTRLRTLGGSWLWMTAGSDPEDAVGSMTVGIGWRLHARSPGLRALISRYDRRAPPVGIINCRP